MNYEPYNFESFKKLVQSGYCTGNYGGVKEHFTLTFEGRFEGWSGRATESWDSRFRLKVGDTEYIGDTLKEVCDKALEAGLQEGVNDK